ncbi:hypothetical protein K440DRAFT_625181 [Wilcoxina mikolae CBS 423.85]|nr:hypothetical protein K440DRAFT_625181 [Wilcoxina mikolae CBS 423.85]
MSGTRQYSYPMEAYLSGPDSWSSVNPIESSATSRARATPNTPDKSPSSNRSNTHHNRSNTYHNRSGTHHTTPHAGGSNA